MNISQIKNKKSRTKTITRKELGKSNTRNILKFYKFENTIDKNYFNL